MLHSLTQIHIVAAGLVVCTHLPPASAQSLQGHELFGAVLTRLSGNQPVVKFVVQATPLALRVPSQSDWDWFGPATGSLRTAVDTLEGSASAAFRLESFPPNTSLLSADNAQRLRHALARGDSGDAWDLFRRQFGVDTLYAFSVPVVTADGLQAFLVYSRTYGPQSGETGFLLLTRTGRDATWTVAKQLPKAIS